MTSQTYSIPGSNQSRPNSFFVRLPYDIRATIYAYLRHADTPLCAITRGSLGLLLSCQKAKEELEELVASQLRHFLDDFRATATIKCQVLSSPHELRSLTVILPFTAVDELSTEAMWHREVLEGLHPLLSQGLDVLRFHFAGDHDRDPPHDTSFERAKVEVNMHCLVRDLAFMIERVNGSRYRHNRSLEEPLTFDRIFRGGSQVYLRPYPNTPVKVKRICLSWDFRSSNADEVSLNGKLHHARFTNGCQNSQTQILLPEIGLHITRPADQVLEGPMEAESWHEAMYYHMRDSESLVGELGIISPTRWLVKTDMGVNNLVNEVDYANGTYVSSCVLGGDIRDGLIGVSEANFDKEDEDIRALLWASWNEVVS